MAARVAAWPLAIVVLSVAGQLTVAASLAASLRSRWPAAPASASWYSSCACALANRTGFVELLNGRYSTCLNRRRFKRPPESEPNEMQGWLSANG